MRNICLNETFDQSAQNNITIDLSIPQPYSLVRDDEVIKCQHSISQCSAETSF